ncbi:MAG TPA: zinc-ribbon domain-containing protein [candidate division Zixibacteria bacterium]|nr:zinc-ribbon domain-containing protein [candidate division Zixibacteria bacterium]
MGYIDRSIGSGNIWTFFIGLGLLIWGIIALINPNITGTKWLMIPGGILLISAISNIFSYRYNRERILGALKSYQRVNMKQLSDELKMKDKDIKEIIVDLRTEGKLKASFDPESGDVVILEIKGLPPTGAKISEATPSAKVTISQYEEVTPAMENIRAQGYCPYCGSKIQDQDRFCITCGSALQ